MNDLKWVLNPLINILKFWLFGIGAGLIGVIIVYSMGLPTLSGAWAHWDFVYFLYVVGVLLSAVILYATTFELIETWIKEDEF